MPEISRFFGIVVYMHVSDHAPPHVHARYAGRNVVLDIYAMRVVRGRMHPRAVGLLVEWATMRRAELLAAWNEASRGRHPPKIPPLG